MRDGAGATASPAGGAAGVGGMVLPAAASTAVRGVLCGSARGGRVLAAFPSAVYVGVGRDVVALETAGGLRLPNALVVAATEVPFASIPPASPVTIGDGRVEAGGIAVRIRRWWDPRPRIGTVDLAVLDANAAEAAAMLGPVSGPGAVRIRAAAFDDACRVGEGSSVAAAGRRLLGLGDGLTPAGDDLLAGALAGWRLFGDGLDDATSQRMRMLAHQTFDALDLSAGTTALSAALLRHAAAGEVPAPVAGACRALAGRAPLAPAVAALREVGHSSGTWLLCGLLLGARS